jgi:hypothetical protein
MRGLMVNCVVQILQEVIDSCSLSGWFQMWRAKRMTDLGDSLHAA